MWRFEYLSWYAEFYYSYSYPIKTKTRQFVGFHFLIHFQSEFSFFLQIKNLIFLYARQFCFPVINKCSKVLYLCKNCFFFFLSSLIIIDLYIQVVKINKYDDVSFYLLGYTNVFFSFSSQSSLSYIDVIWQFNEINIYYI